MLFALICTLFTHSKDNIECYTSCVDVSYWLFSLQTHCTVNPNFYLVNIRSWVTAVVLEVGSALHCCITLWLASSRCFFPRPDDWCSGSPGVSLKARTSAAHSVLDCSKTICWLLSSKKRKEKWTLDLSTQENIYKACLEGIWGSCVWTVAARSSFLPCSKTKLCCRIYCDPSGGCDVLLSSCTTKGNDD